MNFNWWSAVPDYIVDVDRVDALLKRLDKLLSNPPVKFDWRASL